MFRVAHAAGPSRTSSCLRAPDPYEGEVNFPCFDAWTGQTLEVYLSSDTLSPCWGGQAPDLRPAPWALM